MTTTTTPAATTTADDRRSLLPYAVGAFLLSAVLLAVGTFLDLTGNEPGNGEDEVVAYLGVLGVLAIVTFVVYRLWYERAAAAPVAPNSALVGGVLAAVTVVAFWTGLPSVFAVGAIVLARKGGGAKATVGLVLSVLALALAIWAAIAG